MTPGEPNAKEALSVTEEMSQPEQSRTSKGHWRNVAFMVVMAAVLQSSAPKMDSSVWHPLNAWRSV